MMRSLYLLDHATAVRRRLRAARPAVVERCRQLILPVLFLLLQLPAPLALRAQVDLTAITGTVTDQQGNRVPNPKCAPPRVRPAFSARR